MSTVQRVLLTGPDLSSQRGGVQTSIETILGAFRHDGGVALTFLPLTLGLHDDETWAAKLLRMLRNLRPFSDQLEQCDVVHLNSTFDTRSVVRDLLYAGIAQRRGRRVIIQFHGGVPERTVILRQARLRRIAAKILSRCVAVLVLTDAQRRQFHAMFGSRVRVERVRNYVDVGNVDTRSLRSGFVFQFLFLGRLTVDKGVHEIIAAAKQLQQEGGRFSIVLGGQGSEEASLRREIDQARLSAVITLAGQVRGEAKASLLANSNALLLPSHHEALPFALLEAFANSMPVIATAVGSIPELVTNGATGYLVPVNDSQALATAMKSLIDDPEAALTMGRAGRAMVARDYSYGELRRVFSGLYCAAPLPGPPRT